MKFITIAVSYFDMNYLDSLFFLNELFMYSLIFNYIYDIYAEYLILIENVKISYSDMLTSVRKWRKDWEHARERERERERERGILVFVSGKLS